METKEKQKVKKLKGLDDLNIGDMIIMKADKCPHSDTIAVVLKIEGELRGIELFDAEKLHFIKSYISFGDLEVNVIEPSGKGYIDEDGKLIVDTYSIYPISNIRNNLGELSQEIERALLEAGYEIPGRIN
ncbi:hypothetical protein HYT23_03135 [Candidatus Pacearchaeota archaeon]|nr:hypothetical protein [Candidatus Pacearchaeota archaeon]